MLSLGMSTNIQTCLEIIVNIWSGPGPGPGDFGRTRPRPRCFYGPGRSLVFTQFFPVFTCFTPFLGKNRVNMP